MTLAVESGIFKLEITLYKQNTRERLTECFFHIQMNHIKEFLAIELKNHNFINNQCNLVCNNIVHNIIVYNTNFDTALVRVFHN